VTPQDFGLPILPDREYYRQLREFGPLGMWAAAQLEKDDRSIASAMNQGTENGSRANRLKVALGYAREKLEFYRAEHSGAYVGGIEYTALIKMIDAAMQQGSASEVRK